MLLFQRAVTEGSLSIILQCAMYTDLAKTEDAEKKARYELLLDLLTPVAKSYPSETGIISVSQGLQILGGYGYCQEFPMEQYYRDIRIHPIHEGTTGIQALDLLGRKVVMKDGQALRLYFEEVHATIQSATPYEELRPYAERLTEALERLQKRYHAPSAICHERRRREVSCGCNALPGIIRDHCRCLAMADSRRSRSEAVGD